MSDQIDLANDHAEMFNDIATKQRKPEGPVATGWCLNCDEKLGQGRRFCDADCRDDYEKRARHEG